jgi:cyclopropane fatty-acyl-phospholipid synthase-like methyltransferase
MSVFLKLEQSTSGKPWRMKLGRLVRRLLPNFGLEARLQPLKVRRDKSRLAGTLDASSREFLKHVDSRVSPRDDMYWADSANYLHIGLSGMRFVERVLEKVPGLQIKNVLDLPCGYGRVLRFLVERFPDARFTDA